MKYVENNQVQQIQKSLYETNKESAKHLYAVMKYIKKWDFLFKTYKSYLQSQ